MRVGPGWTYLMKPKEEFRWSAAVEEAFSPDAACEALRNALGYFFYKRSDWEGIKCAVDKDSRAVAATLQRYVERVGKRLNLCSDDAAAASGDIVRASIVLLKPRAGALEPAPSADPWSLFSMVAWMGSQRLTKYYDKHGHATSETRVNMSDGVPERLRVPHRPPGARELGLDVGVRDALRDAAESQDVYVIRLDQWYSCTWRGPAWDQAWEGELVLLCLRMALPADRIVTLCVPPTDSDILSVSCVSLAGKEVAIVSLSRHALFGQLRAEVTEQLEMADHASRLKLLSASKGIVERSADSRTLQEVLL